MHLELNYSWWFQPLSLSLASIQRVPALPAACNLTGAVGQRSSQIGIKLDHFPPNHRGEHKKHIVFQKNTT